MNVFTCSSKQVVLYLGTNKKVKLCVCVVLTGRGGDTELIYVG